MKKVTFAAIAVASLLMAVPANILATESVTVAQNLSTINTMVSPDGSRIVFLTSRNTEETTIPMISVYNVDDGSTKSLDYTNPINFGIDMTYSSTNKFFAFVGFDYQNAAPCTLSFVRYDTMQVQTVPNIKGNIIKVCATGNYIVWLENGLSDKSLVMAKNIENTSDPVAIATLDNSGANDSSLCAFEYNNSSYALFADKSDNKSSICLYNITDGKLSKLADTESVESNPRYQAGKVFYTKSKALDPNFFDGNLAGGSIECVNIDGTDAKTVIPYDETIYPHLVSNINNPSNFIFSMINKKDGTLTVKKYDVAASSVFDAYKPEPGILVSMGPESSVGNKIVFTKLNMKMESQICSYDFINSQETVISDSKDIKVFSGILKDRVAFVSLELKGSTPRDRSLTAIKLMLGSF